MSAAVIGAAAAALAAAIAAGQAIADMIPTYRQCTIWIENKCNNYTLTDSRMYIHSGHCKEPLTPVIGSTEIGGGVFAKTPHAACGSVGVITYDLQNNDTKHTEKMAVMFSAPYNHIFESNWYAVGIFDRNTQCNYNLYEKMYYYSGPFIRKKAKDPGLTYRNGGVTIRATMSDEYTPVIKLQISDD